VKIKRSILQQLTFSLPLLAAAVAAPADAVENSSVVAKQAPALGMEAWITTLGGLGVILALIFVLAWGTRRLRQLAPAGRNPVTLVGGVSLGPRERVVVLDVDETRIVVGVAPGQVRALHVMPRPEAFSSSLEQAMVGEKQDERDR
jgi:flagellar protein FliO/FliZ